MKKIAKYTAILVASGLVFSSGVFADDVNPGKIPQVGNQAEKTEVVRQSIQTSDDKQEQESRGKRDFFPSSYGEEYWKNDPQLHLWEQQEFVLSWYSDC
jgi:hypothetical protein